MQYFKAVATKISVLYKLQLNFVALKMAKMASIFEDEGISQQRRSILIASFIVLLFSLTPFRW